jgi:hypothetical protein
MNVGVDQPTNFAKLAETLIAVVQGPGRLSFAECRRTGRLHSDITRSGGYSVKPVTSLSDGLAKRPYYRQYKVITGDPIERHNLPLKMTFNVFDMRIQLPWLAFAYAASAVRLRRRLPNDPCDNHHGCR